MGSQERPIRLFEVLTRNRQSALELWGRTRSTPEQPPRMCTIPPRQQLSITTWLAIRTRQVTQFINTHKYIRKAFNNTDKNTERETWKLFIFILRVFFSLVFFFPFAPKPPHSKGLKQNSLTLTHTLLRSRLRKKRHTRADLYTLSLCVYVLRWPLPFVCERDSSKHSKEIKSRQRRRKWSNQSVTWRKENWS